MRYEVYLDSVVVLTWIFNIYQLNLVKRLLRCTATQGRIILAAAVGAFVLGGTLLLPFGFLYFRMVCGTLLSGIVMLRLGFRFVPIRNYLKVLIACILCSFVQGGLVVRVGSLFISTGKKTWIFAPTALLVLDYVVRKYMAADRNNLIKIRIPNGNREITFLAILDTGNLLRDPLTGEPVSLISKDAAEQIRTLLTEDTYRVIPYSSVGCRRGILEAYRIPEIIVCTEMEERHCFHSVLAITDKAMDKSMPYQMILHPSMIR